MSSRVEALPFRVWRDHITSMIHTADFHTADFQSHNNNSVILRQIEDKLAYFEEDLLKLKEVTTILELVLWKMRMNEKSHQDMATQSQEKLKADNSSIRQQSRITCGADVIIGHVLPFLITIL
jgi:demethoxyubiquinone hydroxylase (CLK1/Coq7/Cat5 family)